MSTGGISLSSILPAPSAPVWDRDEERAREKKPSTALVSAVQTAPPYGQRKSWIPRSLDDFGDGGAYPEIHVAQYPMNLGRPEHERSKKSNALAVQLDASGKVKYDLIAKQGHGKDKIVYSKYTDLLPKEITNEEEVQRPDEDAVREATEKTRAALEKLTASKVTAALPVRAAEKLAPAQYIRYTPSQQGEAFNSGAKQRVIRMVEAQRDPMSPPRFKINKKIPRGPPSPPAPVMHSPTRKVTVKEQQDWKIPPCISNWKNARGYTIPLDKRLAADGRGLQQNHINENFAKLAESLYIADRKARESVEARAQLEKKLAANEKAKKEKKLQELARKAREERAGLRSKDDDKDERERDELRNERHKERARQRNIANAAPDRRSKLERGRERDVSEQIALGIPAKTAGASGEGLFDSRLFNQSRGLSSGYGDDESYNVYTEAWRKESNLASNIYRPGRNVDKEAYGGQEDLDELRKTSRFVPDKEFSGTDRSSGSGQRAGPVQFEKDEEDPFGLDQFLDTAKRASKRPSEDSSRKDRGESSKRRKDY